MTPNPLPVPPQSLPPQQKKSSTATIVIILVMVALGGCCGVGVLAAIAIPNFIKFQSRSKQSECKTYLKSLFQAEKSYFAENDTYSDDLEALAFSVERTRYAYVIGRSVLKPSMPGVPKEGLVEQLPAELRQSLGADEERFTAACIGNVDNDATLDVWTISSESRVIEGQTVPAGMPHNARNDVSE